MDEFSRFAKKTRDDDNLAVNVEQIQMNSITKKSGIKKSTVIRFTFSVKNFHYTSLKPEHAKSRTVQDPLERHTFLVNLDQFRSGDEGRENARQNIDEYLELCWHAIPENWRQQWIEMALDTARGVVRFLPATHNKVSITLHVTTSSYYVLDERKEAILRQMLAKIKNSVTTNMEPFVTRCGHNVRGACLEEWSAINRCCPICRGNSLRTS